MYNSLYLSNIVNFILCIYICYQLGFFQLGDEEVNKVDKKILFYSSLQIIEDQRKYMK